MLEKILKVKEKEVEDLKIEKNINPIMPERSFYKALKNPNRFIGLIAEIKKASPSKGVIKESFDPINIAQSYEKGGADCISVLTDQTFFQGSKAYIKEVKETVDIPVLRKDFIIDEKQVYESKKLGADAILLIAEALAPKKLKKLYDEAMALQLDVLVEVHSKKSLEQLLDVFVPKILGVNNRNLTTFRTNIHHLETISPYLPKDLLLVSESGIFTKDDLNTVKSYGAQAVLVGESLMKNEDQQEAILELFGENKSEKDDR
ncbi:indole-3-glycerol phosphate synthase TrpC [Aeribacillus alveayuensis]|uniref:Indole-3-glycerol phosphate synthase n=1 Tax=Aeribacillus alveayuensis TaxID=279215 RepID=A0ABT9VKV5_9BACI|nr:indole-3-glycerol phosphate synthase [Bacillus alveayuensis]